MIGNELYFDSCWIGVSTHTSTERVSTQAIIEKSLTQHDCVRLI